MKFSNGNFLEKEKVNLLYAKREPTACPPPEYYQLITK